MLAGARGALVVFTCCMLHRCRLVYVGLRIAAAAVGSGRHMCASRGFHINLFTAEQLPAIAHYLIKAWGWELLRRIYP